MITFTGALVLLFLGYLFYGAFVERIFGVKADAAMPCDTKHDGVDYMPLPTRRVFLIQFLNIRIRIFLILYRLKVLDSNQIIR